MSTRYCSVDGCKRVASNYAYGKPYCNACFITFKAGMAKAARSLLKMVEGDVQVIIDIAERGEK